MEVPEQVCAHMERIGFKPIAIEQDISNFDTTRAVTSATASSNH